MNRKDYLMAFYDALGDLPHEIKAASMSEYRDYFDNGLKQGQTEEEISASLGDPVALAYGVRQRSGMSNFRPKRTRRRFTKIIIGLVIVAVGIGLMINPFNIRNLGNISVGVGGRYSVDEFKEIDLGGIKKIEIDVISSDTTLETSQSGNLKAELTGTVYTTNSKAVPTLEVVKAGDVLTVTEKRETPVIMGFNSSNINMNISIPKDFDGEVILEGVSGDIDFTSGHNLKKLKISVVSGDIKLNKINTREDFEFHSVSGDFKAEDLSINGNAQIASVSGDTVIDGLSCGQITMSSTSGDIKIIDCKADLVSAKSISGNFSLQNFTGNGFTLDADTTSGSIDSDYDLKNESRNKKSLKGTFGSGETSINVRTTSGDIKILD